MNVVEELKVHDVRLGGVKLFDEADAILETEEPEPENRGKKLFSFSEDINGHMSFINHMIEALEQEEE